VSYALELVLVVLLILWNAFFVAAEYAFVSVRHTRLDELVGQGERRARIVRRIVSDPSRFITAMQLGIQISALALGAVGEPAVSRMIESLFSGLPHTVSVVVAFALITVPSVVVGEIIPKSYTLPRSERVALVVARPIRVFFILFSPIIRFLDWLAQSLMRLLGIPTTDEQLEGAHSEEELRLLVHRSRGVGLLEAEEEEMIGKVFDFADTEVRQVMVPRPDVVLLPIGLAPRSAMEQVLGHPYTRYPVYDGDVDDIVGILHVRTLFGASQNGGAASADLRELIRPAHTVPETKRLADLLGEFRRTKSHMAIVVDEYGSLAGIATLEDLIEEIVGEIEDEFDVAEVQIEQIDEDTYRISGMFPIDEFNERFGTDLPDEDFHTVGGYVFGQLGRAAEPGDDVSWNGVRFDVLEVDGNRIERIGVTFNERPPARRPDDDPFGDENDLE
jgi:CBS domain containing-hemolysin-like protein